MHRSFLSSSLPSLARGSVSIDNPALSSNVRLDVPNGRISSIQPPMNPVLRQVPTESGNYEERKLARLEACFPTFSSSSDTVFAGLLSMWYDIAHSKSDNPRVNINKLKNTPAFNFLSYVSDRYGKGLWALLRGYNGKKEGIFNRFNICLPALTSVRKPIAPSTVQHSGIRFGELDELWEAIYGKHVALLEKELPSPYGVRTYYDDQGLPLSVIVVTRLSSDEMMVHPSSGSRVHRQPGEKDLEFSMTTDPKYLPPSAGAFARRPIPAEAVWTYWRELVVKGIKRTASGQVKVSDALDELRNLYRRSRASAVYCHILSAATQDPRTPCLSTILDFGPASRVKKTEVGEYWAEYIERLNSTCLRCLRDNCRCEFQTQSLSERCKSCKDDGSVCKRMLVSSLCLDNAPTNMGISSALDAKSEWSRWTQVVFDPLHCCKAIFRMEKRWWVALQDLYPYSLLQVLGSLLSGRCEGELQDQLSDALHGFSLWTGDMMHAEFISILCSPAVKNVVVGCGPIVAAMFPSHGSLASAEVALAGQTEVAGTARYLGYSVNWGKVVMADEGSNELKSVKASTPTARATASRGIKPESERLKFPIVGLCQSKRFELVYGGSLEGGIALSQLLPGGKAKTLKGLPGTSSAWYGSDSTHTIRKLAILCVGELMVWTMLVEGDCNVYVLFTDLGFNVVQCGSDKSSDADQTTKNWRPIRSSSHTLVVDICLALLEGNRPGLCISGVREDGTSSVMMVNPEYLTSGLTTDDHDKVMVELLPTYLQTQGGVCLGFMESDGYVYARMPGMMYRVSPTWVSRESVGTWKRVSRGRASTCVSSSSHCGQLREVALDGTSPQFLPAGGFLGFDQKFCSGPCSGDHCSPSVPTFMVIATPEPIAKHLGVVHDYLGAMNLGASKALKESLPLPATLDLLRDLYPSLLSVLPTSLQANGRLGTVVEETLFGIATTRSSPSLRHLGGPNGAFSLQLARALLTSVVSYSRILRQLDSLALYRGSNSRSAAGLSGTLCLSEVETLINEGIFGECRTGHAGAGHTTGSVVWGLMMLEKVLKVRLKPGLAGNLGFVVPGKRLYGALDDLLSSAQSEEFLGSSHDGVHNVNMVGPFVGSDVFKQLGKSKKDKGIAADHDLELAEIEEQMEELEKQLDADELLETTTMVLDYVMTEPEADEQGVSVDPSRGPSSDHIENSEPLQSDSLVDVTDKRLLAALHRFFHHLIKVDRLARQVVTWRNVIKPHGVGLATAADWRHESSYGGVLNPSKSH